MFGRNGLKTFALAATLATAGLAGSGAAAATVNLGTGGDATGDGSNTGSFSSGGVTGTISAGCGFYGSDTDCDLSSAADTPTIQITANGMGVQSDHDLLNNQIDSANNGEYLTFTFDTTVSLLSVDFAGFNPSVDNYDIYINGALYVNSGTADPLTGPINGVTSLTIVAGGDCGCDAFKVKSFVAAVPLPAGGLMLAGALGAVGLVKRRRRRA